MDIFREQIDKTVYEQKKMLDAYTQEYEFAYGNRGEEHLICCRNHNKDTYYRVFKKDGKNVRKSLSMDMDAISALARKEYLRISIDGLKNNIDVIEAACGELEDLGFEATVSKMYKAYRGLPEESFFASGAVGMGKLSENNEDRFRRHREWANESYEKSDYKPEGRRFMTSAGFRVRSKSEQHIVEQLVNYGVPFRYEQVIHINDRRYSADFTFRDRNRELFYWEHAGMMDVPSYVSNYYHKMDAFGRIGIVPWKNLIVTYDIDEGINVPMIKSIIEHDVIPRL